MPPRWAINVAMAEPIDKANNGIFSRMTFAIVDLSNRSSGHQSSKSKINGNVTSIGFAINPRVTVSATFLGSYIEEDRVNGIRIAGGIREPMYLRFGATISRHGKKDACQDGAKTIEPFLIFGLTEEAVDAAFGVSCIY